MSDQLQLRHWQQIKQAQALEYAGTPDGSAALAESKRYGLAADRIDELAAQVEAMRAGLMSAKDSLWNYGCARQAEAAERVLAIPNTDTAILRQRDARTLREAAGIADRWGDARTDDQGGHALRNYAARIRNMAAELERKNG